MYDLFVETDCGGIVKDPFQTFISILKTYTFINPNTNSFKSFTLYVYVLVKLWHFILTTLNRIVQSIRIPIFTYAFHERCAHITALWISMNRKCNLFVTNWYDLRRNCICKSSHIKFLSDCSMCIFKMMILILGKYAKLISIRTSDIARFGFIQMNW